MVRFDFTIQDPPQEYHIKNGKSGTNRPLPPSGVLLFLFRGRNSRLYRDARLAVSAPILRPALQTHFDAVTTYGSEFIREGRQMAVTILPQTTQPLNGRGDMPWQSPSSSRR